MTGLRRGLALATLGAATSIAPSRLIAAERVELVEHGAGCEMSREQLIQLRAELEAAGFDVVEPHAERTAPPLATVTCAASREPSIDIALPRGRQGPDRRVIRADPDESTHSLVLRVTEFLRARVLEVAPPRRPETTIAARRAVTGEPPSLAYSLELGAAALLHLGGLTFSVAPAVALGVELAEPLWVDLRVMGPFLGTEYGGAGNAHFDQELALVGGRFLALQGDADVFVSAAVGAFRLGVKGEARAPFQSLRNSAISAAFAAGAGTEVRIATAGRITFTLGARADAVLLAPEPALRIAETAVASAGQPACALTGTLGALW